MLQARLDELIAPVAESMPCGPDLDFEEDPRYMNFMAWAEGVLPSEYFKADEADQGRLVPFQRDVLNYDASIRTIDELLSGSRDLRLLTIRARFAILNRDLASFAQSVQAMATVLSARWDEVHPRAQDSDFTVRLVTLQTLDDLPTVIQPLQHAPLIPSRRYGFISYRMIMLTKAEAVAREGEEVPESSVVETALQEVDLPTLTNVRDHLALVRQSLAQIRRIWLERAGPDHVIDFPRLTALVDRAITILEGVLSRRDPQARMPVPEALPASPARNAPDREAVIVPLALPTGSIQSASDAAGALAAVATYFQTSEPSSPALLLVLQAERLIGKSFCDVLKTLLPTHADQAVVRFGTDQIFELPIGRLFETAPPSEPEDNATAAGETAPASTSATAFSSHLNGRTARHPGGEAAEDRASPLTATSRTEAIALLEQVGAFYRASEPASPIPLLTDRACSLSQKDFLSLLKDVLPGLSA